MNDIVANGVGQIIDHKIDFNLTSIDSLLPIINNSN